MLYNLGYVGFNCNYCCLSGSASGSSGTTRPAASAVSGFQDITPDAYYADAVRWAVDKGIIDTALQHGADTFPFQHVGDVRVPFGRPIWPFRPFTPSIWRHRDYNSLMTA